MAQVAELGERLGDANTMLEKCNSAFVVELAAENESLRRQFAELRDNGQRLVEAADGWKASALHFQQERNELERKVAKLQEAMQQKDIETDHMREAASRTEKAEAERDEEKAIVDRIWDQLGRPSYEKLKGRSIYDLVDELKAENDTLREAAERYRV